MINTNAQICMAFRSGQNYTDGKNMLKTKYVSRNL